MIHCKLVNKHIDLTKYILFNHQIIHTFRVKGMIAFSLVGPLFTFIFSPKTQLVAPIHNVYINI